MRYTVLYARSEKMDVDVLAKRQPYIWKKQMFEKFLYEDLCQYDITFEPGYGRITIIGPMLVDDFRTLKGKIKQLDLDYKIKEIIITNVHNRTR